MIFIIFHGAFGDPEENWFPQLKEELEALNQRVIIPKFPTPENQNLDLWIKVFEEVYRAIDKKEKLCFIGHSLAPLFILHLVNKYNLKLDSAIFVSPFMDKLNNPKFDKINKTFYKTDFDFEKLKKLIPVSYVLHSDNDPYVNKNQSISFGNLLDSSLIFVKKAGHMNSEVNLNEFPLVLELCKTRLDLSLYQKYLAHRSKLYSMEYIKEKPQASITIKPEEIMDEGVFHFRNLKHEGFCTFISWQKSWNPKDKYYEDGRKAAKRMKNFSRVFLIKEKSDFKNPLLIEQIDLDLKAGIKVYLCLFKLIENKIEEFDFGIWDNDYFCIIKYDDQWKQAKEITLDSRNFNLKKAKIWEKIVLKNSFKINNISTDLEKFINNYL